MMTNNEIIQRIERFCIENSVAETTFGRIAVNDGKLVNRLRDGKSITLETLRRIDEALKQPRHQEAS